MTTEHTLAKGKLLIAEPFLGDPNFKRSVILICEHNNNGSIGFTLTQKTKLCLANFVDDNLYPDIPLYIGGPVESNTIHFLHRLGHIIDDSIKIRDDIYWGGNFEQIIKLLNVGAIKENDIRFFMGYSGWGSGQLKEEIEDKSWFVSQANSEFIFDTSAKDFWRGMLKQMDGKYKMMANYPLDPRLN